MRIAQDLRSAAWHFRKGGVPQLVTWRKRQLVERGFVFFVFWWGFVVVF